MPPVRPAKRINIIAYARAKGRGIGRRAVKNIFNKSIDTGGAWGYNFCIETDEAEEYAGTDCSKRAAGGGMAAAGALRNGLLRARGKAAFGRVCRDGVPPLKGRAHVCALQSGRIFANMGGTAEADTGFCPRKNRRRSFCADRGFFYTHPRGLTPKAYMPKGETNHGKP